MKKNKGIWILGIGMLVLTGCQTTEKSRQAEPSTIMNQTVEEKNPFDLEALEESGQIIEAAYGWTVANYDSTIRKIDVGKASSAELMMEVDSSGACELGYMLFVDGIVQQYEVGDEKSYLVPVECNEGISNEVLNVTPMIEDDREEHILNSVCLYHPSFRVSAEKTHYGNYHRMSQLLPWKISGAFDKADVTISTDVIYQPISEDIKEKYIRVNRDGTVIKQYETMLYSKFYQNDVETQRFQGGENTQLILFGGEECTYRISLFVNHCPVAVFSGAEYIDVTMKKEQMALIDLDFSEIAISDYSCLYAILCPLDSTGNDTDPLVEKTESITFFQ